MVDFMVPFVHLFDRHVAISRYGASLVLQQYCGIAAAFVFAAVRNSRATCHRVISRHARTHSPDTALESASHVAHMF